MFLTVGYVLAVVGVRLVLPVLLVSATTGMGPVSVVELALQRGDPSKPGTYGFLLESAHPMIAGFGGMFLLMVFLHFIFDEREVAWLRWVEVPLARIGRWRLAGIVTALVVLVGVSLAAPAAVRGEVALSGLVGVVVYLLVSGVGALFESAGVEESGGRAVQAVGLAGFMLFMYVNVLDASFSLDGVVGAFAITADPLLIMLGLGVGAVFVRSLTVLMVRRGTLESYVFLEHGAHWAIGSLAVVMLVSVIVPVPEWVTVLTGVGFIAAAVVGSVRHARLDSGT